MDLAEIVLPALRKALVELGMEPLPDQAFSAEVQPDASLRGYELHVIVRVPDGEMRRIGVLA